MHRPEQPSARPQETGEELEQHQPGGLDEHQQDIRAALEEDERNTLFQIKVLRARQSA